MMLLLASRATLLTVSISLLTLDKAHASSSSSIKLHVTDSRNAFDLFAFHTFTYKHPKEQMWKTVRVSLLTQLVCSIGMFLSGGLAFPWLVEFYYVNLVQSSAELKDAVSVEFTGEDLIVPCLKSLALNVMTLGCDFMFGFTHQRLSEATGSSLRFKHKDLFI